jgi:hypothetical protein
MSSLYVRLFSKCSSNVPLPCLIRKSLASTSEINRSWNFNGTVWRLINSYLLSFYDKSQLKKSDKFIFPFKTSTGTFLPYKSEKRKEVNIESYPTYLSVWCMNYGTIYDANTTFRKGVENKYKNYFDTTQFLQMTPIVQTCQLIL